MDAEKPRRGAPGPDGTLGPRTIDLQIGDADLRITTTTELPLLHWPVASFEPFLASPSANPDLELRVHVVGTLPELGGNVAFDSDHGLWRLLQSRQGLVLEALDTRTRTPRSRSLVSADYRTVEVWLLAQRRRRGPGWLPMHVVNPIAEVCLVTRLGREGGFLLHSAGVALEEEGWLFTGPSGAGKSTLSGLLAGQGARVLSDERTVVRRVGQGFSISGTPWVGARGYAANRSAPLTGIFCIRHGRERHRLTPLSPVALSRVLVQQAFLPHWDREALEGTLATIGEASERVDGADLAALKDASVLEFLRAHSPAQAG